MLLTLFKFIQVMSMDMRLTFVLLVMVAMTMARDMRSRFDYRENYYEVLRNKTVKISTVIPRQLYNLAG